MIILVITLTALYLTAFEQSRQNLTRTALSQARLLESIALFDQEHSDDYLGGSLAATLSQIDAAFKSLEKVGETGEFLLAQKQGNNITFLLISPGDGLSVPEAIPFETKLSESMRRALSGKGGVMIGLDYDGVKVLAAYQPVKILNFGIVVKIDIAEIRAPFVKTGAILTLISILLTAIGSALFIRVNNYMLRRIKESEFRYRHLIENTKVITWELDLNSFCFTFVSPHAEALLGYPISEWKTEDFWADHIHSDDRENALSLCNLETKAGRDHSFEYRMIKADGNSIWMHNIATVNKNSDGEPVSLSGILVDINDKKNAQADLVTSENRYQRAIAGINDGIWDWNIKTGENYFSPRWAEILGYDPDDLEPIVETFTDIVHPDDRNSVWDNINAHFEHNKPFDIEFRMRKKNNDYIWVLCKGSASQDEDGQPTFMAGSITDITDRKLSQDKLQKSEQNLAITLNSIGDAVIATDADGLVTRMNTVAEKLTGWSFQEAEGQPLKVIFSIIDASSRLPMENPVDKVLTTGETVYLSNHTTLIAKDGTEYQIADSAAPIHNGDDKILGMVLVFNDVTESYLLREKAKAVHEQLRGLFDDMQTMVCITDVDGTLTFANNTPLTVAGITLDHILGKKIWETIWFDHDPKVQASVQNDCERARAGKNTLQDIQIATTEGLLWIAYSTHPVLNAEGQVIQLLHEGRDISKRKKSEEDIRESEQHLKLYREQAPMATIEWNVDFEVISWNKAAENMFGYSLNDVKGRDFVEIMLPKSAKVDIRKIWKDLIAQSGGTKSINENLTKDGRIILCEWHNTPLRNKEGLVIGAASLVLDITTQNKAQQALLAKEREQREILDSMVDAVISIDEEGNIVSFNKTAEGLFGYSFDEIIGKNISCLITEPDSQNHDGYLQNYLKTGDAHVIGFGREVVGLRKNKQSFPMRLSIAELPADEAGKKRFIGSCQDLTHIKQQEELLRRTQKMEALGKLTGGIAHDFNNMLGVIMGYADLIQYKLTGQPKLANYVDQIHRAGERGAKLTKKLLDFSQNRSSEAAKLDINVLLREQQYMLQKTLTVRIKLLLDLGDSIWPIRLDSSDLENAILNMSINAMHAMEYNQSNAILTICTSNQSLNTLDALALGLKAGDYVQLSLTDTGCGIDPATKEKIFDPFFTTKGDKGTGLGLSQVFGFVKRADGIIKVYSEQGHGSKFVLYFPRFQEDNIEKTIEVSEGHMDLTGQESILIVDDEAALRDLTSELLSGQGYQIYSAEDGNRALKILGQEHIDLILSDVIMPEMNGYQLAAIVQEKYPAVKIQLASGFTDDRHMDMVDESLHKNLLYKPYNTQTLFTNIRTLLDEKTKPADKKRPPKN